LLAALTALRDTGHTITIVSNNSDAAVQAFLTRHGLRDRCSRKRSRGACGLPAGPRVAPRLSAR
jgi:FMN phosphatase YigB (HAD superfamily)